MATVVAHLSLSVWAAGGPVRRRKQKAEPLAITPGLAAKVLSIAIDCVSVPK